MHRRTLLGTLTALPFTPDLLPNTTTPPLPIEEESGLWWLYVQHSIKIGDPKYCTDNFLNMVVMRSNLDHTTDQEAKRVIRAAFQGAYSLSDVPEDYRR